MRPSMAITRSISTLAVRLAGRYFDIEFDHVIIHNKDS